MSVYQPMLYVSPATEAALRSGVLVVVGSVVRDSTTGRIVEHLTEIDKLPTKDTVRVARAAITKATTPKGAAITAGSAAAIAVGAGAVWVVTRPQRQAKRLEQRLNHALVAYLEAAAQGQLSQDLVQDAIDAIVALEAHPRRDELPSLTQLGIDQIAADIARYTHQLTRAPIPLGTGTDVAELSGLRHHLEIQKGLADGHGDNQTPSTAN